MGALMSRRAQFLSAIVVIISVVVFASGSAEARCRSGYYGGCGQWASWGGPWGPGVRWGQGNPYYYGSNCRWLRLRTWHNGHHIIRHVRRRR